MKKYLPLLAVAIVAMLFFVKATDSSYLWMWIYRWAIFGGLCLAGICLSIWDDVAPAPAIALFYFSVTALIYASVNVYPDELPKIQQGLRLSAAYSLFYILLPPLTLWTMQRANRRAIEWLFWALTWAAVLTALGCFQHSYATVVDQGVYFLHNPSIACTFIAIIAVALRGPLVLLWLLFIPAMIWSQALTPLIVFVVGTTVRVASTHWRRSRSTGRFITLSVFLGGLAGWGLWVGRWKLSNGHGRYAIWQLARDWIDFQPNAFVDLFGAGAGSVPIMMPIIQLGHGYPATSNNFYFYLHNDWLQILFEQGYVGLGLAAWLFYDAFERTSTRPATRGMLVAYCVAMCTNFPMRVPMLALLGITILGWVYLGKPKGAR